MTDPLADWLTEKAPLDEKREGTTNLLGTPLDGAIQFRN
jgi:hypothetical protein